MAGIGYCEPVIFSLEKCWQPKVSSGIGDLFFRSIIAHNFKCEFPFGCFFRNLKSISDNILTKTEIIIHGRIQVLCVWNEGQDGGKVYIYKIRIGAF
jgi:hypothetical protein